MALTGGQVSVSGNVYQTAAASVTPNPVNFGIVHVGDTVAAKSLAIGNTASGALTDVLRGGFGTVTGPFSGTGTLGNGVAGGGNSTALQIGLNTQAAGIYSGSAALALVSHDAQLADAAVTAGPVTVNATVNNYAVSGLGKTSGSGTFTSSAHVYTLDFGTVAAGTDLSSSLFATNLATGPADVLAGTFDIVSGSGFDISGLSSFANLAAGMKYDALSVAFDAPQSGSFNEVITLHGTGSNASGYSGSVGDTTLIIKGAVQTANGGTGGGTPVPEPASLPLLGVGVAALIALRRLSRRAA
jgi:hypothetical protein